jgi:2-oxoglutarate dehydrogenase E1 component
MDFDLAHLSSSDISFIDGLYEQYKKDPKSVDVSWTYFFRGLEFAQDPAPTSASSGTSTGAGAGAAMSGEGLSADKLYKEFNVFRLIQSFRARGHLLTDTNPIRPRINRHARISLDDYGLTEADLTESFRCGEFVGLGVATLKDIIAKMKKIYCDKIGIEYMHSNNTDIRRWVRNEFESGSIHINYPFEKKKRILQKLNEANVFENFLQTKYPGQKRFSLEGGDCTIPALDTIINFGSENGAETFIIGMAHRGRLNVLANIIGKTYEFIFSEFEGERLDLGQATVGSGDVKYHMGYGSYCKTTAGKDVYLKLLPNPSHLEPIGPVVLGFARSQLDVSLGQDEKKIIPIIIHGDAAVAGQGVVYEMLQMSKLPGYRAGGTIHFIINNQIGFTTDFQDGRSSQYCVSFARTLDAPILHVNGDCPEEVVYACEFAVKFRQTFHEDIYVDMVCYRKHGHNEGDEPKYTQPHLYGLIAKQKNPRELYLEKLLATGEFHGELAVNMQEEFKKLLSDRFNNVKQKELPTRMKGPYRAWEKLRISTPADFESSPVTGVDPEILKKVMKSISSVPAGFNLLQKAAKIMERRQVIYDNDEIDWATAEMLAYGTLLLEGHNIRFSGQDVIRGTFSHRHAKFFDEFTNQAYCGLEHLDEDPKKQGQFYIYNSLLSEYAVLGFEYGYSNGTPESLNIWEAQFGDFANGAQIIIDQFISAGESKWGRMSGLVLLLPHGYEGQGPEHSSARPERFLQMAAEDNMIVANCTTPDNFYHILRRQQAWQFRKPLVVFSPKSLLRDPQCVCTAKKLQGTTKFQEVIDDHELSGAVVASGAGAGAKKSSKKSAVRRVLFCSGKIYYQLLNYRTEHKIADVAIVRIEQLYPFPKKAMEAVLENYAKAEHYWVQEEPLNMGSWSFLLRIEAMFRDFTPIGRSASASPATGFGSIHKEEQQSLLERSFRIKG